MPALQLSAHHHLSRRIDAVDLKHRLGNVETDCRDRFHGWLPITATAPAAVTSTALTRRRESRPQHQKRTCGSYSRSTQRMGPAAGSGGCSLRVINGYPSGSPALARAATSRSTIDMSL